MATIDDILGVNPDNKKQPAGAVQQTTPSSAIPAPQPVVQVQQPSKPTQVPQPPTQQVQPSQIPDAAVPHLKSSTVTTSTSRYNQPQQPQRYSLADIIKNLSPNKPLTPEQQAEQIRKEKRDKLFSSLSDGISAMANLIATTKGAPNAFDARNSLSAKAQARWDKIKAERDANNQAYFNQYLSAVQADDANDKADRDYQYKQDVFDFNQKKTLDDAARKADEQEQKQKNWDATFKANKENNEANRALKAKALGESARHNRVAEAQGAAHLAIASRKAGETQATQTKKGRYTIRLNDGSVHEYTKDKEGALKNLANKMYTKAVAASDKYMKMNKSKESQYYSAIAKEIREKPNQALSIVLNNVGYFPSLDGEVRSIIGSPAKQHFNANQYKVGAAHGKPKSVVPPLN